MNFTSFIRQYNDGSITQDAAWRAYDIEGMAKPVHAAYALPLVNYKRRRDSNLYAHIGALYGIGCADRAVYLLSLWYVWRAIAMGDRKQAVLRVTD